MYNQNQLNDLAQKFGQMPKALKSARDILASGYLTQEELDNLKFCPRSKEMESGTKWPEIGGRTTYPISGALTQTEHQIYNEYRRSGRTNSSSTVKSVRSAAVKLIDTPEDAAAEDRRLSIRAALKDQPEMLKQFDELCPPAAPSLLRQLFGVGQISQLQKCTIYYLMFRGPNGEFLPPETTDKEIGTYFVKGFMPKYTLDQINQYLETFKNNGIDLDGVIIR